MAWRSYVAMGDSFTEGLDDPYPDGRHYRGWADLVAARLAGDVPDLHYANLAIRGRLFASVVAEQVPVGRQLAPELMSFAAGGNDALRRRFDPARLAAALDDVAGRLRSGGADLLLFTFAPANLRLPGRQIFHTRARLVNPAVADVAARHGARLVDLWSDGDFANPLLWSIDRLHLNGYGHRRVAAHALTALGITPEPDWWELPPAVPRSWVVSRAEDVRWAGQHLAPWLHRRLTGRSSGDDRQPKRPALEPFGT